MSKFNLAGKKVSQEEAEKFERIDNVKKKELRKSIKGIRDTLFQKNLVLEIKDNKTGQVFFTSQNETECGSFEYYVNSKVDFKISPFFNSCSYSEDSELFLQYFKSIVELSQLYKDLN